MGWALSMLVPGKASQLEAELQAAVDELYDEVVTTVREAQFEDQVRNFLHASNAYDRSGLSNFLDCVGRAQGSKKTRSLRIANKAAAAPPEGATTPNVSA